MYDEVSAKFVEGVERLKIGNPLDDDTQMGAVISLAHLEKVESYIQLGIQEGGILLTGGTKENARVSGVHPDGAFLRPTVIGGLPHTARTATEEIFGPVVTLHAYKDEDEAVMMANCTDYGLAGSVWTADIQRGRAFAERMETGIVWVNTWLNRDLRTPFGGVKQSGVGREGGTWSMSFFSEMTNVCVMQP
jgi:aminomuconate-semialdehyde/2-hydroxymuconate-6-semialdehyde dehydrogenase